MGKSLVDSIPTHPDEYQMWLQTQRDFFAKWDDLLQEFLTVKPEDLYKLLAPKFAIRSDDDSLWQEAFDERLEAFPPTYASTACHLWTKWTYTMDLFREVFSVDHAAHFRFSHVARTDMWIKALALDADRNRLALPQFAEELAASLAVDIEDFAPNALEYWDKLELRMVTPNLCIIQASQPTNISIRQICFDLFQKTQKDALSNSLLGWTAKDMPLREIAYFIVCLAAGGDNLALVDTRRLFKKTGFAGIYTTDGHEEKLDFAGSLGAGCKSCFPSICCTLLDDGTMN